MFSFAYVLRLLFPKACVMLKKKEEGIISNEGIHVTAHEASRGPTHLLL